MFPYAIERLVKILPVLITCFPKFHFSIVSCNPKYLAFLSVIFSRKGAKAQSPARFYFIFESLNFGIFESLNL